MDGAGDMVGRYRLIRQLGAGGMGTVWLAARADGAFDREVALKLLHPDLGAGEPMARFLREREILGGLDSPSIARILDAGVTEEGRPFLVMEAVDGVPIDRFCEDPAHDGPAKLRLLARVARAVGHAHSRHVIHRDIKPANVLVTPDGEVKLIDFGIASWQDRPLGRDAFVTQGPLRFLTKDYAAPEQLQGAKITAPSDVFAIGALSHEILLGSLPAGGRVAESCTGDLRLVLEGALRLIPEERYAHAGLLADDLDRVLDGEPVRIRALGRLARVKRWLRHHRDVAAVLAGAAAILVLSLSAASISFRSARASLNRATVLQQNTTQLADGMRGLATEQLRHIVKEAPPGHARERMIMNMTLLSKRVGGEELTLACATASLDLAEHWGELCAEARTRKDSAQETAFRSRMEGMIVRTENFLAASNSEENSKTAARQSLHQRMVLLRDSASASR